MLQSAMKILHIRPVKQGHRKNIWHKNINLQLSLLGEDFLVGEGVLSHRPAYNTSLSI